MAGTGFILRKLAHQDNLSGVVKAFLYSTVIAVGPWILIVFTLTAISSYTSLHIDPEEVDNFLSIIVYNLFFSLVFSAPLYVVSARYTSDCLYKREMAPIPGILITNLGLLLIPGSLLATCFYFCYATLSPIEIILSVIQFLLLSATWYVSLFLSSIHNFRAITICWVLGMVLTAILSIYCGNLYGAEGMLFGTNVGLAFLLFSQTATIFAEYAGSFALPKELTFYFHRYQKLFWSGLFLYAGMWIDKVIMWGSKEAIRHGSNLTTYPVYDQALFLSYLTIIFLLALFIFSLEANFYLSYIKYIQHIERNAPLAQIEATKKELISEIKENGRSALVLQGTLSLSVILLAPMLFNWFGISYLCLNIFCLGTLGSFFAGLNLILYVYFSYFDSQENMLCLSLLLFFSNAILTLLSQHLGFAYYGYGYCLSMILTFCVSATLFARFLDQLTYRIFIDNVVKRQKV